MAELIARQPDCGCGCTARSREAAWQEWALQQEADDFSEEDR